MSFLIIKKREYLVQHMLGFYSFFIIIKSQGRFHSHFDISLVHLCQLSFVHFQKHNFETRKLKGTSVHFYLICQEHGLTACFLFVNFHSFNKACLIEDTSPSQTNIVNVVKF